MPETIPLPNYKDLIARLPRTFGPALNGQFRSWDVLFPAEQRVLQAQLDWLSALPPDEFKRLLAPVAEIEKRMELPRWEPGTSGMSVQDVGLLARSPYYPQWRTAVEGVFSSIDDALNKTGRLVRPRSAVFAVLPAGVPLPKDPLWPSIGSGGRWIALDRPLGQFFPAMIRSVATRRLTKSLDPIEATWVFECDTALSSLSESSTTVLSWATLETARREFLNRLNRVSRSLRSVDQTTEDLRKIELTRLISPPAGANLRVREFVRELFLSGNGSLVFNNSFVQWGAAEALRRVQPQVLVAAFGIRPKLKPFSSTVLFEDQKRSNPTPDADDPAGSAVDAIKLAEYVHLSAQRVQGYQGRSMTLLGAYELDRVLVVGPNAASLKPTLSGPELESAVLGWLGSDL